MGAMGERSAGANEGDRGGGGGMEGRAFDLVRAAGFSSTRAADFAARQVCQHANNIQPLRYVPVL